MKFTCDTWPRVAICCDGVKMRPSDAAELLQRYHDALAEAHRILLHEMDNGRTPTMLQGVGLGYFEDVLYHVAHTTEGNK